MEEDNRTIGGEVRVLSHLIHRCVDVSPVKCNVDSLTGANAWIIGYIGDNDGKDIFQRDFEKKFGITRSTASKVVNLMVQKGLIERQSIPHDARLKKLVLTEKSWEIYHMMTDEFDRIEKELQKGFSEEELNQFFDYVHRMQKNATEAAKAAKN